MIVFAGNTPSYHHAREPHQGIRFHADASQGDIYRPICKRVWRIDDAKFLTDVMPRALNVAQTGRRGPVLLDVPMDVFSQQIDDRIETLARRPEYERFVAPDDGIADAARLLASAERPLIFAGNGVLLSEATSELRQLAELLNIPVATTLMGKGVFPERHPLAVGMTGIWGTAVANSFAHGADVVLAVGTAFGEADCSSWDPRFTFSFPPSRLIQIDIEPQEVGKIYPVDVGLVGDAKATLRQLIRHLRALGPFADDGKARIARIAEERRAWEAQLTQSQQDAGTPIHPARLLREISKLMPDNGIFVTDVGWNKNGAGQQIEVSQPGSFITSGGMATMGFAPGAAIGAKLGAPDRKVVCLVGDGGLLSSLSAFATTVELGVPVVFVIFNNFCFSTIRTVGTTYFNNAYGTEFKTPDGRPYNPDFPLLARAFGIESAQVIDPKDLAPALERALSFDGPFVLEVQTRGDVPMPRTGHWDIAEFLRLGND
jgi:acetolactate synthase-1/2/3 large subunit